METAVGNKPTNPGNPSDPSRDHKTVIEILSVYKENPIIKTKNKAFLTLANFP